MRAVSPRTNVAKARRAVTLPRHILRDDTLDSAASSSSGERDRLLSELYDELRAAAARMLRRDAPSLTFQPADLVNEASLRIMRLERMSWNDRQHFFATGARIMRQAMLDAVRSRKAAKRQAPDIFIADENSEDQIDIEFLDAALKKLETIAPDLARIVEMRFFVGLKPGEIAEVLESSEATVKRRWKTARLWLASELEAGKD